MRTQASALLLLASLTVAIAAPARAAGDPANGEKLFKKCAACHSVEPGKKRIGPSLHGVIGRTAGTAEDYRYSKAMAAYGGSGVVRAEQTLEVYLEAPRNVVKGTKMAFPGLKKPEDRADVIAYLKKFSE